MFGSLGFPELILIFIVVLLLFGPKKLPEFAKLLGKTIREFKSTVDEAKSAINEEIEKAGVTSELKDLDRDIKDVNREIRDVNRDIHDSFVYDNHIEPDKTSVPEPENHEKKSE